MNNSRTLAPGPGRLDFGNLRQAAAISVAAVAAGLAFPAVAQHQPAASAAPPVTAHQALTPVVKNGITCRPMMVPMRDGTKLYTEVYLPAGSEGPDPVRRPVVTVRSPYAEGGMSEGCFGPTGTSEVADLGLIAIYQSVRGTGQSEGKFTPILQEASDGFDLIEWAARQPWSDGKVGTTSGSYLGLTQWQAALKAPPSLKVMTPLVIPADPFDDMILHNGVFDLQLFQPWAIAFVGPNIRRKMVAAGAPPTQIDATVKAYQAKSLANKMWLDALPLSGTWDAETRAAIPFLWDWYDHPSYDAHWRSVDVSAKMDKITVPVQVGAAWFDLFTKGTIDNFQFLTRKGGSPATRQRSMLIIECCGHAPAYNLDRGKDEIDWGPLKLDYTALRNRFLQRHLLDVDNGIDSEPRVQFAVLVPPDRGTKGDTFVFRTSDWPVPGTRYVNYNLSSGGRANSLDGDGVLDADEPSRGSPDSFSYDPKDPVPSLGGGMTGSAVDQTAVERRKDVLVYTAAPATQDMLMVGKITASFWAVTDGKDTDFTAKLVDVHPDGFAHEIAARIVRARYRQGTKKPPKLVAPGRPYEYKLELGYTATLLKPGHRLRLEISSSNFPRFQRNLNTGESNEATAETRIAMNTILHDARYPSFVTIPVIDGGPQLAAYRHETK